MEHYVTPLDRARALRDELIAFATVRDHALPTPRYVQVGDIVRDCECLVVSVGNLTPDVNFDPVDCVALRSATFLVEIIRGCAVVYDDDGMTIPELLEEVSEQGAADGQLLDDFAREGIDGWTAKTPWSVLWSLTDAGLQVASLQLTIGIP